MNTPAVLSRLFFLLTRPMKLEETGCSETSAHKIQKRGITQKKECNIQITAKVLNKE